LNGATLIGALLFFDFIGLGYASILTGDLFFYTGAFNANGIIDGWTTLSTIPETGFSLESYQACKTLLISSARAFAPPLSRLILDKIGWTLYAFVQLFISFVAFCISRQMLSLVEETNIVIK